MTINTHQLKNEIVQVATTKFPTTVFRRRQLMRAVEARLKEAGAWTDQDDLLSGSAGIKSRGMAQVDWRITDLGREHLLLKLARDQWRLP
jgi:hypothetical protein